MDTAKTINVSLKNVYQLLISEMRYGYRRNNHLMPSCGYDKVKTLVPQMYEVDKEYAIYTMKQLCEECISDQLSANFYDGEEDEHGNRAEAKSNLHMPVSTYFFLTVAIALLSVGIALLHEPDLSKNTAIVGIASSGIILWTSAFIMTSSNSYSGLISSYVR